jgi:hypothetical protein
MWFMNRLRDCFVVCFMERVHLSEFFLFYFHWGVWALGWKWSKFWSDLGSNPARNYSIKMFIKFFFNNFRTTLQKRAFCLAPSDSFFMQPSFPFWSTLFPKFNWNRIQIFVVQVFLYLVNSSKSSLKKSQK